MTAERGHLRGAFSLLWKTLDQARRLAANLIFLFLVSAVVAFLLLDDRPRVKESTALVVAPSGRLVEQVRGGPLERALLGLVGRLEPESLMRTLLEALEAAEDDERVKAVMLDLDRLDGAELSKLQTLRGAIERVAAAGKPVVASADFYTQAPYYLAAGADEVFLHEMGLVLLTGYGSYRNYFREALDRLEVSWNVFRVGEYKSAVEPYLRNEMSPEVRESRRRWLGGLWRVYARDVAADRGLEPEEVEAWARDLHLRLEEHGGDGARAARAAGLVDEVAARDRVRDRLIELVGEDEETGSYNAIDYRAYLRAVGRQQRESDNVVAVVVAKGTILDGNQPPGLVGGDSTARLIRSARNDETVKALVLRVDSPGGSALASEIIRREVELTRETGRPVIASMGSVAASGGYWISMAADEIWASPTTITGSIGIYAMVPTFERTLGRLGVTNDGIGTGPLAGTLRPDRELPPEAAEAMRLLIDQGYEEFITRAAAGRGATPEEIDAVARGQVWLGDEAQGHGLVDRLGDLDRAIAAAAERAGLDDDYRVAYFEQAASWSERVLASLLNGAASALGHRPLLAGGVSPMSRGLAELAEQWSAVRGPADPGGLLAYCFCETE